MSLKPSKAQGWIPPYEFEEYRLVRLIGHGAMGQVYLAHDTVLDRPVALKFIGALELYPDTRARFLIEARAAARLQHPNVVAIHRVGEVGGRPFIVSEFVHGASLDKIPKPVPWQQALELGIGLARGLAAAHARGVLHRDIKPANAMLTDSNEIKLLDFSLAKLDLGGGASSMLGANGHALVALAPPINSVETQPKVAASSFDPLTATMPAAAENAPTPRVIENTPPAMLLSPSITETGQVMGTPLYMAPEVWGGEEATRRSDVYSLGAILFELCAGRAPSRDALDRGRMHEMDRHQAQPLLEAAPEVDPRIAAIVDRSLRRDPAERFTCGEDLLQALEQLAAADRGIAIPEGNPYRGLQAFEAEHRALFFGRQKEIAVVVELLRGQPIVVVGGDSGVGKSSLCRAGVLPLLQEGALGQGRRFTSVTLVPGKHPLRTLAHALSAFLEMSEQGLIDQTEEGYAALGRALRKELGSDAGLVLFVDQLEELVTLSPPLQAATFGGILASLAEYVPGIRVLATVRADFIGRVATLEGLGELVPRGLFVLRELSREGMQQAIVGPAQAKGVRFESDALVERLLGSALRVVRSVGQRSGGALPLLQFALAELWEARGAAGIITEHALNAIGGVDGALARHADQVVSGLLPAQRVAARHILRRLVTAQGTRSRRIAEDLTEDKSERATALEALVRGRLVIAGEGEEGTVYELAHEALITGWATLCNWLSADAENRAAKQRLEIAASEWERLGRAREALWGAPQLAEMGALDSAELGPKESAFLSASARTIRQRKIVPRLAIAVLVLAVTGTYGAVRFKAKRDRDDAVASYLARAETALARARADGARVEALRKEAFAKFDGRQKDPGERTWAQALAMSSAVDESYGGASQELEAALMLDPTRKDIRGALFGQVIYERALTAERDRRNAQRDELIKRLPLYDATGDLRRMWDASGMLTIKTTPTGAIVRLERYVTDSQGKRNLVAVGNLGSTPVAAVSLAPGSYRLALAAHERISVYYPLVVRRGESLSIDVPLPKTADLPKGFVLVPPGRFLFGAADESLRASYLETVPIHEVQMDGFLISRDETTFGEWLTYLESGPPGERARHTPRTLGLTGAIELKSLSSGSWQLALQPTTHRYEARLGEKIRYRARDRRREQDWQLFPVSGISALDARAYVDWLRSGRVPGARLCTEHEWERAARGADDREFPHGDALAPDDANFEETYGKEPLAFGPDEVGSHPASDSPFGVRDMSGNVWEWTESSLAEGQFVLRGGSQYQGAIASRVTNRHVPEPAFRDLTVGLRVCADMPPRLR